MGKFMAIYKFNVGRKEDVVNIIYTYKLSQFSEMLIKMVKF